MVHFVSAQFILLHPIVVWGGMNKSYLFELEIRD